MARNNNNNEFLIDIKPNIKDFKNDIRKELKSVLTEAEHMGKKMEEGFTPDTSEFEHRLNSLEKAVENLTKNCSSVKEQVSSMQNAFTDFVRIQGEMNGQTKQMLDLFNQMTPKTKELFDAFIVRNPVEAMKVLEKAAQNVGTNIGSVANNFDGMRKAANDASNDVNKSMHEVEVNAKGVLDATNNVINASTKTSKQAEAQAKIAAQALENAKKAAQEMERISNAERPERYQSKNPSLPSDELAKTKIILTDLSVQEDKFVDSMSRLKSINAKTDAEEYNKVLLETLDIGSEMISMFNNLSKKAQKGVIEQMGFGTTASLYQGLKEELTDIINPNIDVEQVIDKVELKPLKLKINLGKDEEVLEQVNKQLDRISSNPGLHKVEIPMMFVDVGDIEDDNNVNTETDKVGEKIERSLKRQVERLNKSFDNTTPELLQKIKKFKEDIDKSLTLKFEWQKGNNAGEIENLFRLIQNIAFKNPITIYPDTESFIQEIENKLKSHKFELNITGDTKINGNLSGAILPFAIPMQSGGQQIPNRPLLPTKESEITTPASSVPSNPQDTKDEKIVKSNTESVNKNTDAVKKVVEVWKQYITKQTRLSNSKKEDSKFNAEARLKKLRGLTFDDRGLSDEEFYNAVAEQLTRENLVNILSNQNSQVKSSKGGNLSLVSRSDLIDVVRSAQTSMGVEMKTSEQISREMYNEMYFSHAESLARMGKSLKDSYSDVEEGVVPIVGDLESVVSRFKKINKTDPDTDMTAVADSAENLIKTTKKLSKKYAKGGELNDYLSQLRQDMFDAQSILNDATAKSKDKKSAQTKYDRASTKYNTIIEALTPDAKAFQTAVSKVRGNIANMLQGYSFEIKVEGENAPRYFNDARGGDRNTKPYWNSSIDFFEGLDGKEYSINTTHTPNESYLKYLYGDTISKTQAIKDVVEAYNQLDYKARQYVDTLIDINKLTDESLTVGEKFDYLESVYNSTKSSRSFETQASVEAKKKIRSNNSKLEQLNPDKDESRILALTEENRALEKTVDIITQANRATGDFLDKIADKYFSAVASAGLKKGQQNMLNRNTEKSMGTSTSTPYIKPSEKKYAWTSSDKSYRLESYNPKELLDAEKQRYEENKKIADDLDKKNKEQKSLLIEQRLLYKDVLEEAMTSTGVVKNQQLLEKNVSKTGGVQEYYNAVKTTNDALISEANKLKASIDQAENSIDSKRQSLLAQKESAQSAIDTRRKLKAGVKKHGYAKYKKMLEDKGDNSMMGWSEYDFEFQENKNFEKIIAGNISLESYLESVTKNEDEEYARLIAQREENNKLLQEQQDKINANISNMKSLDKGKDKDKISELSRENDILRNTIADIEHQNKNLDYDIGQNRTRKQSLIASQKSLYQDYLSRRKNKKSNIDIDIEKFKSDAKLDVDSIINSIVEENNKNKARLQEVEQDIQYNSKKLGQIFSAYGTESDIALLKEVENLKSKEQTDTIKKTLAEKENQLAHVIFTRLENTLEAEINELKSKKQTKSVKSKIAEKESLLTRLVEARDTITDSERMNQVIEYLLNDAKETAQNAQANIESLDKQVEAGISTAPFDSMSDSQKKLAVVREVEKINHDLDLAQEKMDEAKANKQEIDREIAYINKSQGKAAWALKPHNEAIRKYAKEELSQTDAFKEAEAKIKKDLDDLKITQEEYEAKVEELYDDLIKNDKSGRFKPLTKDDYEKRLTERARIEQDKFDEADKYKKLLLQEKQAALAKLGVTEQELFNQREITKEKEKQVELDKQPSSTSAPKEQPSSQTKIEEQVSRTNSARIQEIDNELSQARSDLARLEAEAEKEPKKEKVTKEKEKKATERQKASMQKHMSLLKGQELKKSANIKDMDFSKSIELLQQLNELEKQGKENTEEYIALQVKLSKLIDSNKKGRKGSGRQGYATKQENYDWIKETVGKDVADFYNSDKYIAQDTKISDTVLKKIGASLIENIPDNVIIGSIEAAKQAEDDAKKNGEKGQKVKNAVANAVRRYIEKNQQQADSAVVEESKKSNKKKPDNTKKAQELRTKITQLEQERRQLVTQGTSQSSASTQLSAGQMVAQAGTVILGGNGGSGQLALDTTLKITNDILTTISGKIDAISGGSDHNDNSSTDTKKKKAKIDVDTARSALYKAADENIATSFGEGTKSVRRFNEDTLKLYETLTLANGETVKFTYSINKMDGTVKSSYSTIANFEKVAKQAYTELGKNQIATKQMFDGLNFPEEKVTAYNNAIATLDSKLKSLGSKGVTNPNDAAEVEVLTGNVKKLRTELEGMVKTSNKNINSGVFVNKLSGDNLNNIEASMKQLAKESYGASVANEHFNKTTQELTFTAQTGKNEITTLTYKFDDLTKSVIETGHASKTTTGFFKGFFADVGTKIGQLARYYTGMSLLTEAFQRARQGVQYVRDIDLALTELKKVTDESESSYNRFLQTMSETAHVVGSTVSELTNSAAAWARLGYSMEEAGELAKNTAILLNVSEFENEEQATEALISSLQAFNYEAKDSIKIVDKLNIIGNNFAISSDGIAEGLSRSASTLVAAGNTLEESIAMLAAGNKVQQDPEGLGNALKVLSMRIRGTKTDLEEAGEETDGMIENTSKLQAKVKALTNVDGNGGVDILTDTGAYKSTYQILLEIAEVWDRINESDPKNQAALLEILAGKTRGSQVASILQNPEDLKDAYEMALDSDGSAQKELNTYLDSIQGRIDLFMNELQTFWMNFINSNVIKFFVDAGTTILEVLNNIMDAIDKVAEGWGALGIIIPTVVGSTLFSNFKKNNNLSTIFDVFNFSKDKIQNIQAVQDAITTYSNVVNSMSNKINTHDVLAELAGFDDASNILEYIKELMNCTDESTEISVNQAQSILERLQAEELLNAETVESILNSELFTAAQAGSTGATLTFGAALDTLKIKLIAMGKAMLAFFATPVGMATLAVTAIVGLIAAYNAFGPTHENLVEKLHEETKALEEVQSQIKSINDELKSTKSRIKELEGKGTLSFTEEKELENLKKQNDELERQKKILEAKDARAKQQQVAAAIAASKADPNFKKQSSQAYSNHSSRPTDSDQPETFSNKFEQKLNEIENAKKDMDEAQEKLLGADINSPTYALLDKDFEEKKKRYDNLNASFDTMVANWEASYGSVGYIENATTEQDKAWNEFYRNFQNYINKREFISGNFTKADILSSTFGQYATDVAQEFQTKFEEGIKNGKDPSEIIQELFNNKDYSTIINELLEYDINSDDIVGFFTQTGEYAEQAVEQIKTTITSLDTLTSAIDSYKNALSIVNTITSDGQAISEDYYNTLKEQLASVTYANQDFSDAIDTSNGYIVKNVSLLQRLVAQSSNTQKANIKTAKSQAQLQYKELAQQIRSTIVYLGAEAQANEFVSQAIADNINVMRDQMEAIEQTIQEYALLELSLSDAANAFDEYEKAKERDAKMTYDDSLLEMLKTIDEGVLKNETGTEAFEYAVKAIVPEQFWKDIDDVDEKVKSIHDYLDGDNVFSRFFYVDEESGELDITADNVREFVDLCLNATEQVEGATFNPFVGDSTDFSLSDNVKNVKDFADQLGVTEAVALAMLTALEKVDAKWGNILTDVTLTPFERKINTTVKDIDTLNQQFADGSIDIGTYATKMAELESKLATLKEEAKGAILGSDNGTEDTSDDTAGIADINQQILTSTEKVNKAQQDLINAQKDYDDAVKEGASVGTLDALSAKLHNAKTSYEDSLKTLNEVIAKRDELSNTYGEYTIRCVLEDIDAEIEAFGDKFNETLITEAGFEKDENGYWISINPELDLSDLKAKDPELASYIEKLNQKTTLEALLDPTKAEESANALQSTVNNIIDAIEKNLITLDLDEAAVNNIVTQANKILDGITQHLGVIISATLPSWLKNILKFMGFDVDSGKTTEIEPEPTTSELTSPKKYRGYTRALGNAYANGNVGLKSNENNSVVGELGRELVCDVDKGVYYTVGDNGTEMVNLPKNAIIYNHKQTEELLKTGHTSRGKLTGGLSFASGNAHSGDYGIPTYHPNLEDSTSLANYTRVNNDWMSATSALLDAADSLSDAANEFNDTINWIDVLFTRIENNISEQEAHLETITDTIASNALKDSFYESVYGKLYSKANSSLSARDYYRALAEEEMSGLDADTIRKIRSGEIEIQKFVGTGNEETDKVLEKQIEKINQAIEYYDKVSEYDQQYWTTITEIADKAVAQQEDIASAYENEIGIVEHLNNSLEAHNDLLATKEGFAAKAYYDAQIDANEIILGQLEDQRDAMQDALDEAVRLGRVKVGDQQWFDMQQAIYDVDDAIIDTTASIEDLQNSINDLHWERFDELINRFGYVGDEISNVIQLLSHDPDGLVMEELRDLTSDNWATGSGLTTIGLYAQEMERAKYVADEYAKAIDQLEQDYAAGKYNETEYLAKLNELIGAQYENIEKYHDAKDAIIELNEARVDAIRDGIEKEIDAYSELIDKKKEALSAEQDLHDFQNDVYEKEKDVAKLRKQLAAMDGDDSAATTAKKKQLQAELVEAQKALEETYYSHSMTSRNEALDKELSDFEEEKNAEIEKWEEWLKGTENVVSEALEYVKENTKEVYSKLNELGSTYGLTLSETLTSPWNDGQIAIGGYSVVFDGYTSSFTEQLKGIVTAWNNVTTAAENAAKMQAQALQQKYKETTSEIDTSNKNNGVQSGSNNNSNNVVPNTNNVPAKPVTQTQAITTGTKVNAGSARIYATPSGTGGGKQYYGSDPVYLVLGENNGYYKVRWHKLSSGVTGWFKKSDVKAAYASGTLGTKQNELALVDELGEELILNTDGNGRLTYLQKGSSVIPHDLTEKLINLALDPSAALEDIIPKTKVPNITTNSFENNLSFDSLVHVDNCNQDTIPALQKMVRTEFNNMMKQVNNGLRRSGAKT